MSPMRVASLRGYQMIALLGLGLLGPLVAPSRRHHFRAISSFRNLVSSHYDARFVFTTTSL